MPRMKDVFFKVAGLGAIIFVGISLLEQIPILGWAGWLVSIAAWIWLARRFVNVGRNELEKIANPRTPATLWSALLGAVTGLVGAIAVFPVLLILGAIEGAVAGTGAVSNNVGVGNTAGVAALGTGLSLIGAFFGIFYWPFIGAFWCGLAGLLWGSSLRSTVVAVQAVGAVPGQYGQQAPTSVAVGTLSPDGTRFWNGQAWVGHDK